MPHALPHAGHADTLCRCEIQSSVHFYLLHFFKTYSQRMFFPFFLHPVHHCLQLSFFTYCTVCHCQALPVLPPPLPDSPSHPSSFSDLFFSQVDLRGLQGDLSPVRLEAFLRAHPCSLQVRWESVSERVRGVYELNTRR